MVTEWNLGCKMPRFQEGFHPSEPFALKHEGLWFGPLEVRPDTR